MKILTDLLKGHSLETFLSKSFTRMPFSMPDAAISYKDLLTWDVVENIIEEQKSVLRIVRDSVVTKDYTDLSFKDARDFHRKGHTLLIRYAEKSDPKLKKLADDFAKSFHTEVDIQLYCTPEGNNAFGWHYDVEEVFIIQTRGSKKYTIRPNTIHPRPLLTSIPKNLEYEKESGELFMEVLLKEGDWLYIPSGWWHVARTQSESMHISVGLMPRSAVDVLEFLPKYLTPNSYWRSRFPVHKKFNTNEEAVAYYKETMERLSEDLQSQLNDPKFIEAFYKYTQAKP